MAGRLRELWNLACSRKGEKSVWRQMVEMAALRIWRHQPPEYYQLAGFWKRGLPLHVIAAEFSDDEYRRRLRELNSESYWRLCRNKLVEKSIWTLAGLSTPAFVGFLDSRGGFRRDGRPLSSREDFSEFLRDLEGKKLCVKATALSFGESVTALEVKNGTVLCFPDADSPLDGVSFFADLRERGGTFLIEDYIDQHPVLSAFNPSSVNTLRICALQDEDGVRALSCFLKVGRKGQIADNTAQGSLIVAVDMNTGITGNAVENSPTCKRYSRHPDHGAGIEGVRIPMFVEARRLVEKALAIMPGIRFVGADIAIAREGPTIVELNALPMRTGNAINGLWSRDLLGDLEDKARRV